MTQTLNQPTKIYNIDLSKTDRDGAFVCPNCKTAISPDDHTETTYTINDIIATDNNLQELILYCKRCHSFIRLRGFSRVTQTETLTLEPAENLRSIHIVAPPSPLRSKR